MLKKNGGALNDIVRFRGSDARFDRENSTARPVAWLGATGMNVVQETGIDPGALEFPCAVMIEDDSRRDEMARVEGAGIAGESPGLYALNEEVAARLYLAQFKLVGVSQLTEPIEALQTVVNPFADKGEGHSVITFTISLSGARLPRPVNPTTANQL